MVTMDTPPPTSLVNLTVVGDRAHLTLNRPEKFNALNVAMINEIIEVLAWTAERSAGRQDALFDAAGNPFLRVLVLRGDGKHFCAGADINMMRDAGANTPPPATHVASSSPASAALRTAAARLHQAASCGAATPCPFGTLPVVA